MYGHTHQMFRDFIERAIDEGFNVKLNQSNEGNEG